MIRINQQSNAAAAKNYYTSAAEYYGAGEQEQIGEWGGFAADRLGLAGEIVQQHFERLCDNRHPFTGERLTARMKANRRVGYDFNFHVCKSLSILYAITGDPKILAAFRWAMNEVMKAMEQGVTVRVRKQGQFAERTASNMAWAEYLHFTARPVKGVIDPHLHGHCFVPNICWDHVEKMWKAIDVASVKENAPHWQEMFHRLLGNRLSELGYSVEWKGKTFEIAGINRNTIERFSGRTHQIDQTAERRGITDPHAKDKLGALTRERKRRNTTMPHLRGEWRERLTDDERAAIAQAARRQRWPVPGHRATADRQQHGHDQVMQRQRIASYERARASYAASRSAPPPPRQSQGYGR
jgi:conjugative relaxase-like TrwC/TraI family protein